MLDRKTGVRRERGTKGHGSGHFRLRLMKNLWLFHSTFLALLNSDVLKFLNLTTYDNLLNLISKLLNIHNEDFLGHKL